MTAQEQVYAIVDKMFDDCRIRMKELGLRTLRIDGEPTIPVEIDDRGFGMFEIHGLYLDGEDNFILQLQPKCLHVKIINDLETGPGLPDFENQDFEEKCWYYADGVDIPFVLLIYLEPFIEEAFLKFKKV